MKKSEICRAAMFHLATTKGDYTAKVSGVSVGICDAICAPTLVLCCRKLFQFLGIERRDWLNDWFLLQPLDFKFADDPEVQQAYTARVMLLELAAILYEEIGE